MIRATILLIFLIVAFADAAKNAAPVAVAPAATKSEKNPIQQLVNSVKDITSSQRLSASVKDTSVNGLEGLNIKWTVPFKVQDYTVGFKYSLADLKKVPDSLFAKRSFRAANGVASVDADYDVADKTLDVATSWHSDDKGLSVSAAGNSKDMLTKVSAATSQSFGGNNFDVKGTFHVLKNKFDVITKASRDAFTAEVEYDTDAQNPLLSVSYKVNDNNVITPAVSLKDGDLSYGWNHKLSGGSIDANFRPGNNLDIEWQDNASNGFWSTKASIPVNNPSGTKVSFSREWNY